MRTRRAKSILVRRWVSDPSMRFLHGRRPARAVGERVSGCYHLGMRAKSYDLTHAPAMVESVTFRHLKINPPAPIPPIVYATDLSPWAESAGEIVAEFARRLRAPLALAHPIPLPGDLARARKASRWLVASRKRTLRQTATSLREKDLDVVESVRPGPSAASLAQWAEDQKARLIVVPHERRRTPWWRRASLAVQVAGRARTPILVLRETESLRPWMDEKRPLNVLVAYNFTASADAALRWVKELTRVGPCEVVLTYVNQPVEDYIRIGARGPLPFGHNPPEVRAVLERDLKARARAILGDVPMRFRIEPDAGRIHSRLVQLAREEHADMIVAGSRQLTGLKRLRSGSISRAVLDTAPMNMAIVPLSHSNNGVAASLPVKRHVLVATDLSATGNAAVPHALALLPDGGLLTLMHVATLPPMIGEHVRRELGREAALAPAERVALSNRLRALVPADAADRGILAQTEVVLAADVGQAISQTAERLSVDAICISTGSRSKVSRAILGSVTRTIRSITNRPLFLVPASRL